MSLIDEKSFRSNIPGNFLGTYLIGDEEIKEVVEVLKAKSIFRYYGPNVLGKVNQFEDNLESYLKVSHALGVSSGTSSLKIALKAIGIGPGDEVIVPAYGFIATPGAVIACDAIPVFADIDSSMNINPFEIEKCITERTRAIIPVHVQGVAANLDNILVIAKKYNIPIIEDAAQSFGGEYKNHKLGTFGLIGCYSFQANKILSTGEGGALVTNDNSLALRAKVYHDQGGTRVENDFPRWDTKESFFGENYRMSELTAAIGIAQLKKIPNMLDYLRKLKNILRKYLKEMDFSLRSVWDEEGDCGSAECFFVQDQDVRDKVIIELREQGINAHSYYNSAVYENSMFFNKQTAHQSECPFICSKYSTQISYHPGICPNAEALARESIWLPVLPIFDEDYMIRMGQTVVKTLRRYKA